MKKFGKVLLVFVALIMITGCGCEKKEAQQGKSAEDVFKEYVLDYYNTQWKNDVYVIVREMSLQTLGNILDENGEKKYDVSKIKVNGNACDAEKSKVEITTPDLNKPDNYTVKVFLTCGSYKSEDQKALENAGK